MDSVLSTQHSVLVAGVDLIEIGRIREAIARHGGRFLNRVYTRRELDACHGRAGSLAARFAGKEAVAKALGTGIGEVAWHEVEILADERGKPTVQLGGRALERQTARGISDLAISISHTRAYAIAFVVGHARSRPGQR